MGRPNYTPAFRAAALAALEAAGPRKLEPTARAFGVSPVTLYDWRRAARAEAAPQPEPEPVAVPAPVVAPRQPRQQQPVCDLSRVVDATAHLFGGCRVKALDNARAYRMAQERRHATTVRRDARHG